MALTAPTPSPESTRALCQQVLCTPVERITRFPTGLCHHVYEVALADGRVVVARMASEASRHALAGGIHWSGILRPLGVPLPILLHADPAAQPFAYMIMERLPGTDLGHVYATLSPMQKKHLAGQLGAIQAKVIQLPPGRGYGYVHHSQGPFPHRSWRGVLDSQLARSRQWLASAKLIDVAHVARVQARLSAHDEYFRTIAPTPFLEDITTKNVIIHHGQLAGIVDVDELCFGDPLYVLALTRMALLAEGLATDYIDCWKTALTLSPRQSEVLDLYTAMHCVGFLGEIGQRFNRDTAPALDPGRIEHLLAILQALLAGDA